MCVYMYKVIQISNFLKCQDLYVSQFCETVCKINSTKTKHVDFILHSYMIHIHAQLHHSIFLIVEKFIFERKKNLICTKEAKKVNYTLNCLSRKSMIYVFFYCRPFSDRKEHMYQGRINKNQPHIICL